MHWCVYPSLADNYFLELIVVTLTPAAGWLND